MTDSRAQMRQPFIDAWQKRQQPLSLSPLEQQILAIIEEHTEYHSIFDDPSILEKDYRTDNNPFLHMSLHLGLIEQFTTNRPQGIQAIYQTLFKKYRNEHQVQHLMMEIMADVLYTAQQNKQLPDEQVYLERLKRC